MLRSACFLWVVLACGCLDEAADAEDGGPPDAPPPFATETIVHLGAGSAYVGVTVRLNGEAQTFGATGNAMWTVRPAIVDQSMRFEVEIDGATETHTVAVPGPDWYYPGGIPFDRLTVYFERLIRTGECQAYLSSYQAGRYSAVGDAAGYDGLLCGAFAPICDDVRTEIEAFVEAAKSCTEDSECVRTDAPCWPAEPCCSVYLHRGIDTARWTVLNAYAGTCSHEINDFGSCGCSCPSPPEPRCLEGRCTAAAP
jgi:hypothetical protein